MKALESHLLPATFGVDDVDPGRVIIGALEEATGLVNKATDGVVNEATDGVVNEATDGVVNEAIDGELDKATDGETNEDTRDSSDAEAKRLPGRHGGLNVDDSG